MASEHTDGEQQWSASLQQLIRESGHTADQRIGEFTRLATAVQRQRHADGVSDTDRITRSTGLWTLMELDTGIKAALERGGGSQSELASKLSLRTIPTPLPTDTAELHDDFSLAMRAYLADRPRGPAIDLMDLAAAIVRAGRDQSGGLLPERLKGLDYEAVLSEVDRFRPGTPQEPGGVTDPPPLSEAMVYCEPSLGPAIGTKRSEGLR